MGYTRLFELLACLKETGKYKGIGNLFRNDGNKGKLHIIKKLG